MRRSAIVLILCILLTACVSFTGGTQQSASPSGELRWSIEGVTDLPSLDPAKPGNLQSTTVISLVFSGLVQLDGDLRVKPDGAERWRVSSDGKVYTFNLRSNLEFADGTPVTAGDFVYAINRALAPSTKAFAAPAQLSHIVGAADVAAGRATSASGVRALDDRTLEITLDAPLAYFLSQLTYPYTFVVPRKLVESGDSAWPEQAYGTGPFQVANWKHGQEIVLKANPHYWQGPPGVATIRLPFFEYSEAAYQAYRAGKLDIMGSTQNSVPANRVAEVRGTPDLRSAASLTVRFIGFNNRRPPFNNRFVRQAFALAVDKQTLANQVLDGTVVPTDRILPKGLAGSQLAVRGQAFDSVNARTTLGLAGFVSGQGLPTITLTYGLEGDNQKVVDALQTYWRDSLGVSIKTQPLPLPEFSNQLDATFREPEHGLQLYLSIWSADYPDPQNFLSQQLRTNNPNNNGHWSNADFDRLTAQADTMGSQEQVDQRLNLYMQAEQIAVDDVAWLPLYNPELNVLVRPSVEGLVFTAQGFVAPDWTKVRVGR